MIAFSAGAPVPEGTRRMLPACPTSAKTRPRSSSRRRGGAAKSFTIEGNGHNEVRFFAPVQMIGSGLVHRSWLVEPLQFKPFVMPFLNKSTIRAAGRDQNLVPDKFHREHRCHHWGSHTGPSLCKRLLDNIRPLQMSPSGIGTKPGTDQVFELPRVSIVGEAISRALDICGHAGSVLDPLDITHNKSVSS